MLCLHGKPAVTSTNENGTFWTCGESTGCFVCSEEEAPLYDKAIKAFLSTNQNRPRCCVITPVWCSACTITPTGERCYAKFRVYTGKEKHMWWSGGKKNIGRPLFTCGNKDWRDPRGCGYLEWGDKHIIPRPICKHGMVCKVKGKPGLQFFGCTKKDHPCAYFEWVKEEPEDPLLPVVRRGNTVYTQPFFDSYP